MFQHLLTWDEIKRQHKTNFKGSIPRWFKKLESDYMLCNYSSLTEPIKDPQVFSFNYKHPSPTKTTRLQWTFHWDTLTNSLVIAKL